jgi:hypothetical protein
VQRSSVEDVKDMRKERDCLFKEEGFRERGFRKRDVFSKATFVQERNLQKEKLSMRVYLTVKSPENTKASTPGLQSQTGLHGLVVYGVSCSSSRSWGYLMPRLHCIVGRSKRKEGNLKFKDSFLLIRSLYAAPSALCPTKNPSP